MEHKALYEAVKQTGECQQQLSELEECLKLLIADFQKRIDEQGKDGRQHKASLEGCQVYLGMVMSARIALHQMFLNFKLPCEVKDALKGNEPLDDPEYVKACVL